MKNKSGYNDLIATECLRRHWKDVCTKIVNVHRRCKLRLCERLAKQSSGLKMLGSTSFVRNSRWIASPSVRKDGVSNRLKYFFELQAIFYIRRERLPKMTWLVVLISFFTFYSTGAYADPATIPLLTTSSSSSGALTYNVSIKILLAMALLSVLPALVMTMTSFTRIIIVFSILRQALGIPNVPSNQILLGLALIMTAYVMMPVFTSIQQSSIQPYLNGTLTEEKAIEQAGASMRVFLLKQTRKADLNMFQNLSSSKVKSSEPPFFVILPAFITSELKTAFQIGFLIFLPFLIIDLVTASVLMSMGMMMLSPMIISLPFKVLFFVMVNGWSLIITSLVKSFRM